MRELSIIDLLLSTANRALAVVYGTPDSARAYPDDPAARAADVTLTTAERAESAALMRVNHVGEVCAQALYEAQAIGARDEPLRAAFHAAANEELDHLAWTQRRIHELGGRTSLLNPLWHAGSFAIGLVAARFGDRASLGFMAETERQVEAHLQGHLERLPAGDLASRRVVEAMRQDEARHADNASRLGGVELPWPARVAMKMAARVMTRTAHYI
ncbi:MAG TPA: 2-polyprenyl-3-methyl-6-methoxy-1,4-benzoquinone monooxygenase [Burkholderiaceae bacterium]|nr:2-polyprenyl-3-methyl-6-methoxy-1,4-benzoquinone monooxygenase [Burkholderiaceae bacterium]